MLYLTSILDLQLEHTEWMVVRIFFIYTIKLTFFLFSQLVWACQWRKLRGIKYITLSKDLEIIELVRSLFYICTDDT